MKKATFYHLALYFRNKMKKPGTFGGPWFYNPKD